MKCCMMAGLLYTQARITNCYRAKVVRVASTCQDAGHAFDIADIFEAGGTDTDDDGRVDNFADDDGNSLDDAIATSPLPLTDTDEDCQPNHLDLDSGNDDLSDLLESGGADVDGDGVVDDFLDSNDNGIPDQPLLMLIALVTRRALRK